MALKLNRNKKGGANYIYAIFGVAMVLLFLGILGWFGIYGRQFSKTFKEAIQVEVQLNDNTRNGMGEQLFTALKQYEYVKDAKYISKEQAAEDYKSMYENYNEVLDFNPLYSSIVLYLNESYVNKDSLFRIKQQIMKNNIVRDVDFQVTLVDTINNRIKQIGAVLLGISIFLITLVIFMIDNTIRLAMYSQRFIIKTMQFVGATRWFISKPFTTRAIINGFISAVIAIVGILIIQFIILNRFPELKVYHTKTSSIILYLSLLVIGILITVFSTHRSVIKYLKTSLDDLY